MVENITKIKEITSTFFSEQNYLDKVALTRIIVETTKEDLISSAFQSLSKEGKFKNQRLASNFQLMVTLSKLKDEYTTKLDQTLNYFLSKLDSPSSKADRKDYFLRCYSILQNTSSKIYSLALKYTPKNTENVDEFLRLTRRPLIVHLNDAHYSRPKDLKQFLKDAESFKNEMESNSIREEATLNMIEKLTEEEFHFITLNDMLSKINQAAIGFLNRNEELLDDEETVKFTNGFPVLNIKGRAIINSKAEEDKLGKRKKAEGIIIEKLHILNQEHKNKRKRIEDEDFKRLSEYAKLYFLDGALPDKIKPIKKTNVSLSTVKQIIHEIYKEVGKGGLVIIKRDGAVDFLKAVFPELTKNWEKETLLRKFAEKAPNFPD